MDEEYIKAQADVMATKLKSSGYTYINLDDGWAQGFDEHGRLQSNTSKFPNGIAALAAYVHGKGLKLGIYLTPGLRVAAWQANGTVEGTQIHMQEIADVTKPGNTQGKDGSAYRLDFSKPGAREYTQSYANMLAAWGVDYIKMDFVGPGGGNRPADTREEIKEWHDAIEKTGHPMWMELSNSLKIGEIDSWKSSSNGWRIEGDVENYGKGGTLTRWSKVALRFRDAPAWASLAGPGGWNDLDSLEIGNGDADGLTMDERKTVMTLWAVSCSPLILGADLTKLDDGDLALLTNAEVLAVDQAGRVATPLSQQSAQQVWRVKNPDGSFTVALFNLGDAAEMVSVGWSDLGLPAGASVRDLWKHSELGKFESDYQATLGPHACQLLLVRP
jgi:alpha-galactosidase